MCSCRVVRVLPSMPVSGATPHIGYRPYKDVHIPTLAKKPLCDSTVFCNACIRWKILHGAGIICCILATNVAIVYKSSGCGADVPPRVVHDATSVPPPDG